MGELGMNYPDRYVITAIVADGQHKGEHVWICWSPEGGGWWQWTNAERWAKRFTQDDREFKGALACAKGETGDKTSCGPWYLRPDMDSIEIRAVPAIVEVIVR